MKLGAAGLGVLVFASVALLLVLTLSASPANAPGTDVVNLFVTVSNAIPSIGAISCHNGTSATTLTPTAGVNTTIWCFAVITDLNGWADINQSSLNVTIVGAGSGGIATEANRNREDDFNNHYSAGNASHFATQSTTDNDSCTFFSASGNTITANCTFNIRHYVDPGAFNVTFNISDNASVMIYGSNTNYNWTSLNYTINSVTAINTSNTTINFGSVGLGATSAKTSIMIKNWGNTRFDIAAAETQGTAASLNCTTGTLTTDGDDGIRFNATAGASFAFTAGETAYRLVGSGTGTYNATGNITDWDQIYPNSSVGFTDTSSNQLLYWLLRLPSSGVGGSCSGVATILAAAG